MVLLPIPRADQNRPRENALYAKEVKLIKNRKEPNQGMLEDIAPESSCY